MRTSTGAPLLVEKPFGKGRVVAFASTCDRDWTNFPVRPAFLPWTHRLVSYLAQEPLGRSGFFGTGTAVPIAVAASEGLPPVVIKKPDGTLGPALASDDPAQPLTFTDTGTAGIYIRLDPTRKDDQHPFAVNLESYESDLTYLDDVLADRPEAQAFRPLGPHRGGPEGTAPRPPGTTYIAEPGRAPQIGAGGGAGRAALGCRAGHRPADRPVQTLVRQPDQPPPLCSAAPWRIPLHRTSRTEMIVPMEAP